MKGHYFFAAEARRFSVEVRHVALSAPVDWVKFAHVLVKGVDLCDFFVGELDIDRGDVLGETSRVGGLHERDGSASDSPGDSNLGGRAALGGGNLVKDWVLEHASSVSSDRGVALKNNAPLFVEAKHIRLGDVRVELDLVHHRFDAAAGQQVDHHRDRAVAHSDILG